MSEAMSVYEREALRAIRDWKSPAKKGWIAKVGNAINKPFELAGDAVLQIPGAEKVIEKSIGGLVSLLNDAAQWSVRPGAILAEYRRDGHQLSCAADVYALDLEQVDRTIGYLAAKYKSWAATEGAGCGMLGLPGIPVDIVALVTMNLRAAGEYAAYCGIDLTHQQERLFAMQVLGLASSPTDAGKQAMMGQLAKIASEVAKRRTWKELERHAFVRLVQQIAKALGIRLTKAKLAQIVPAAGAAIGGGFNAYYTAKVCTAASYLYRERFLAMKYGGDVVYGAD